MYQVRAQCGYEIQVIGTGENGRCRVVDRYYAVVYSGTYEQCVTWLKARAIALV